MKFVGGKWIGGLDLRNLWRIRWHTNIPSSVDDSCRTMQRVWTHIVLVWPMIHIGQCEKGLVKNSLQRPFEQGVNKYAVVLPVHVKQRGQICYKYHDLRPVNHVKWLGSHWRDSIRGNLLGMYLWRLVFLHTAVDIRMFQIRLIIHIK
jgi:hypothetical protein